LILANAAHIRNVPGRKRDVNDATWIAELLAHGLIRARFVPPQPIQESRDLTRTRKELTGEIIRHKRRIIHVFLDHARCHRVKLVRQWLARPGCRISSPTRRSASCADKPLASERTSAIRSLITFATRNSRRDPVGLCLSSCFGWLERAGVTPFATMLYLGGYDQLMIRRLRASSATARQRKPARNVGDFGEPNMPLLEFRCNEFVKESMRGNVAKIFASSGWSSTGRVIGSAYHLHGTAWRQFPSAVRQVTWAGANYPDQG
jgi:hypothetical protein